MLYIVANSNFYEIKIGFPALFKLFEAFRCKKSLLQSCSQSLFLFFDNLDGLAKRPIRCYISISRSRNSSGNEIVSLAFVTFFKTPTTGLFFVTDSTPLSRPFSVTGPEILLLKKPYTVIPLTWMPHCKKLI